MLNEVRSLDVLKGHGHNAEVISFDTVDYEFTGELYGLHWGSH